MRGHGGGKRRVMASNGRDPLSGIDHKEGSVSEGRVRIKASGQGEEVSPTKSVIGCIQPRSRFLSTVSPPGLPLRPQFAPFLLSAHSVLLY
jgi:hypothetical protein